MANDQSTPLTSEELLAHRMELHAQGFEDPDHKAVRELSVRIVDIKQALIYNPGLDPDRRLELTKELHALDAQRSAAKNKIFAESNKLRYQVKEARVQERAEAEIAMADAYDEFTLEELEAERHALSAARREIKAKMRGVLVALNRKQAASRVDELLANLSPEERAALAKSFSQ